MDKPYKINYQCAIKNIEVKPQLCKVRKWWIGLSNRERERIRKEKNIDLVLDLKVLTKLYEDNH